MIDWSICCFALAMLLRFWRRTRWVPPTSLRVSVWCFLTCKLMVHAGLKWWTPRPKTVIPRNGNNGMTAMLSSSNIHLVITIVWFCDFGTCWRRCRGAPAALFLAMRAYEVFELPEFLDVAERLADHVFRFGLMRKGNGLCHGTAGMFFRCPLCLVDFDSIRITCKL